MQYQTSTRHPTIGQLMFVKYVRRRYLVPQELKIEFYKKKIPKFWK